MQRSSDSWGLGVFIVSLLATLAFYTLIVYTSPSSAVHRWVLPALAGAAGLAVLTVGHFSYPRVQNLKVYLAGYVTGLVALSYVAFEAAIPAPTRGFLLGLFALALVNAFLFAAVPSFLKFRTTRTVTWVIVGVEFVSIVIMRFAVPWPVAEYRFEILSYANAVVLVVAGAVAYLAARVVSDGFHLGGTIAGYALLLYGCWLATFVVPRIDPEYAAALTFVLSPAYLTIGGAVHWFARIEHRVSYDPLLQVYNRDFCAQVLSEQSMVSTRPPFSVVMIDIDHFKHVNDTYGHQAGDRVLFAVAQRIQQLVVPEGVVCRYGGEEIAVFFPQKVGKDVVPLLREVRRQIEEMRIPHQKREIAVTVSIGISYRYRSTQKLEDVVRAADKALYMCKNHGRNQIRMVRIKEPEPAGKV